MKANKTATVKKTAKPSKRYSVKQDEYNGNPLLVITDTEAKNPKFAEFRFGLGKARMILACIDEIQEFVDENPPKSTKD